MSAGAEEEKTSSLGVTLYQYSFLAAMVFMVLTPNYGSRRGVDTSETKLALPDA